MLPVRGYGGRRVAVLGLGRSGLATVEALIAGEAEVLAWDDSETQREAAEILGAQICDLSRDDHWQDVTTLIVSPGIPHLYPSPHPVVASAVARGIVLDNDIGLFFRSYAGPDWDQLDQLPRIVCVTGSNGKSTTTALIAHTLSTNGKLVQTGGNIGRPALDLDPAHDGEIVVLELSSYQTDLARALTPDIAVFLNLSDDHLERHGGRGGYFAAKSRLFREGAPERAIIGIDEPEGRHLATLMRDDAQSGDPVIRISTSLRPKDGWAVHARKGFLSEWRKAKQIASFDLRPMPALPGAHNHQNACAAYATCRSLGLSSRSIEAAFATFGGLPHRCQIVTKKKGVTYVNDSKATNADAAQKALLAFSSIRWIAGGQPKEGGIASLLPLMDRVAKTYLIGEAAEDFARTLGQNPNEISGTLDAALKKAASEAEPGDVVLLAPACASWDQFDSFEARGEAFEALAKSLPD